MTTRTRTDIAKLGREMLRFASTIDVLETPESVLDNLNDVTFQNCKINVLVAAAFPKRWGDWSGIQKGKTLFLHASAPKGWYEEWLELSQSHPGPVASLARLAIAPFTRGELMQKLEPIGLEQWPFELGLKYGMRDSFCCPVAGRWVIAFWSRDVLTQRLCEEARTIIFMGATFAAIRLQRLVGPQVLRLGKGAALTPRELAVLRLLSIGYQIKATAEHLELGEETIRSHLKKAQAKLGVKTQVHAVAQAIRQHYIP
jgi:DNA-binding CsgD family transcriptional regulator